MIFCELLRVYNHNASLRSVSESRLHTNAEYGTVRLHVATTYTQLQATWPTQLELRASIFFPRCRNVNRFHKDGRQFHRGWSMRRAADVTPTQMRRAHTGASDRGIPQVSTHTPTKRTLLKRDSNRRLIGQLVVADVKSCSGWKFCFAYIDYYVNT